ncbi:MAG: nitroreductase family deazaflavin-dependent oxidoreductase [Chloroflexota bacterium]
MPIIYMTLIGAKAVNRAPSPLVGIPDDGQLILIASNWGRPRHPAWYYNIKANPQVSVTSAANGNSDLPGHLYTAHELAGDEREAAWRKAVATYAGYGYYAECNGGLPIPLIALRPADASAA